MSKKNTALFAASLLAAATAVAVDYATSEAPPHALAASEEAQNPCAAATPPAAPGERNYDDIADAYSGGSDAPMPAPAPAPEAENPCSIGAF